MPARLTVHHADHPAGVHLLDDDGDYLIGRDPECAVAIDDDRISRRHARLSSRAVEWTLADLGSKNGAVVDGRAVESGGSASLGMESWISLGGLLLHFQRQSSAAVAEGAALRRSHWRSLADLSVVSGAEGVDGVLRRLLASTLELTGAERGFVVLADPDGELSVAAASGIEPEALDSPAFRGSVGAVREALGRGAAVATSDALADPLLGGRQSIAGQGIRALVAVPLRFGERVGGALYADSQRPGSAFNELDVEILEGLAAHAAVALAASWLEVELRELAGRVADDDSLPAAERQRLAEEIARAGERATTGRGSRSRARGVAIAARHERNP
jgi:hypothetical protein